MKTITTNERHHNRSLAGILGCVAAATLLAACADQPQGNRRAATSGGTPQTPVAVPAASTTTLPSNPAGGSLPPASETGTVDGTQAGLLTGGTAELQGPALAEIAPTPEETRTAWREGLAAYDSRDYETAGARLQIAAAGRPDDAYIHYMHGLALWKSDHLAEAQTALERSASIDGASIRTWINLARVCMARKESGAALEAADQALTLDPGSADALHQRGRALAAEGRPDEALETLQQARAASPDNGYIANTLGHLLLTRGRVDEAIPHLEAARDRLPEVAFVRNNLGVAYERSGDLDRAVEEYRAAVEAGDPEGKATASLARLEPLAGPRIASDPATPGDLDPGDDSTGGEDSSS